MTEQAASQTAFSHTGADQSYVVPAGVTAIQVKLWGAGGAREGGSGAFVSGILAVTPGETLTIIVGGGGVVGPPSGLSASAYGGGGRAIGDTFFGPPGSGGGRSAIRRGSTELVTAGAGGGGYGAGANPGGGGGLLTGVEPTLFGSVGRAGTQTAGGSKAPDSTTATNGSPFQGGTGHNGPTFPGGPGGGSGYYGGGGGASDANTGGAGGGSSFTTNLTSFVGSAGAIGASAGVAPGGSSDSDYIVGVGRGGASSPTAVAGGHGRVVISIAGPPANSAPTDITLSPSSLSENNAVNAIVGTLTAADPNLGDTHTYSLVSGAGSTHNSNFSISGSNLRISVIADREVLGTYSIRVRAVDSGSGNLSFEKPLTVTVNDVNDVLPTINAGQNFGIAENSSVNTVVGTVTAMDGDVTPTTFSAWNIVSGNVGGAFSIVPGTGQIRVATSAALDFETTPSFTLGITVSDGVNTSSSQNVTLQLSNVPEAPVIIQPSSTAITSSTATLGGTITTDGGSPITGRGVVYAPTATDADPFIGDAGVIQITHASNATGIFTVNVTGLASSTGYSFKAYATNGISTVYTATDNFTTGAGSTNTSGVWLGTALVSTPGPFDCTGLSFEPTLGFLPTAGTPYTFLHAGGGITGTFNDLPDGGVVAMATGGVIFYFQVDYGLNDITLTPFTPTAAPAWKWLAGAKARNGLGSYGTLNVPAPTNNPGARQGAMNWRSPSGSLWMFGGYGHAAANASPRWLNDLWEYDRTIGRWIWRSGSNSHSAVGVYGSITVEASANVPTARHTGSTWADNAGNLWLFGGVSPGGRHNDLWRFRPTTGQWTWMKGSNTVGSSGDYTGPAADRVPSARQGSTSWFTSDGSLWLFGGFNGSTYHNDLWRYSLATGNWTLVKGSSTTNLHGTYGTKGTPAPANSPGARRDSTGWAAKDGSLWIFGGLGLAATGAAGDLNDLWRFNPATSEWVWISGSNGTAGAANYGTLGTPSTANTPGARSAGSGWSTVDGKFWLIGGFQNSNASFSDVWIFNPLDSTWAWTLGANTTGASGVYGTLGIADPANKPGARFTPSTWVTLNGTLWLFGGGGVDGFGGTGRMNDLWSYSIPNSVGAPWNDASPAPFPDELIVNNDPSIHDASAGTMAYITVRGQLIGSDADGDKLTYTLLSQGTLTLAPNGIWTYTPPVGFTGLATFQFKATDNYGGESLVRTLVITVSTNPADSDNDGIADAYEQQAWGSLAADGTGDADLDGQSNYFEFLAGTDPRDGRNSLASAPSVAGTGTNNGTIKLRLNHVRPGVNYHLETSTDLNTWTRIGTFTFSVFGAAEIEDPTPPTSIPRFYRMNLEATPAVMQP